MNVIIYKKKYCIIIGIVLLSLMIIGSFFDYQISQFLYNQNNVFGIFLASYGQLPAMLCFAVGGTLLLHMLDKHKKIEMGLCYFFAVFLNLFAVLGITMDPMLYIQGMPIFVSLVIAIAIVGFIDVLVYRVSKGASKETIKKIIILVLTVVFIELIVINIVKIPWARPRMRMISSRSDASFQPWWIVGSQMKSQLMALGVASEEFKSFPSGHTANAACAMLLCVLPMLNTKLRGKEDLLFFVGVLFAFLVAFSRIIMGAHFVTDVVVGMSVSFIIQIIVVRILFKHQS